MTVDRHYTSTELADTLVSSVTGRVPPQRIADFACGEGSLLLAAERRWPGVDVVGNDISTMAVQALKRVRPAWNLSAADFLQVRSVRSSKLKGMQGSVDLILLNPPFSCRDKKKHEVQLNGQIFFVSVATAFVINSIPFLTKQGNILAVLPDGCLINQSDQWVWSHLRKTHNLEIIRDNARSAFSGVSARTCLVRISPNSRVGKLSTPDITYVGTLSIERGGCQMHRRDTATRETSGELVHTSHLAVSTVTSSREHVYGKLLCGPALLFPRVGRVTPDKLCILESGRQVVLSDCILAVAFPTTEAVIGLRNAIVQSWPSFASSYRGTGAPYITVARAKEVLAQIILNHRPSLDLSGHSRQPEPSLAASS